MPTDHDNDRQHNEKPEMIPSTKLAKAILFCNIFYGVFLTAIMIFAWLAAHGKSQVVSVVWIYPIASLLWAWASWLSYKSINKLRRAFESQNKTLK